MEPSELIPKLEKLVPGGILEARTFGRARELMLWSDLRKILPLAQAFANEGYDGVEMIAAVESEQTLMLSYFLTRSPQPTRRLCVRGTLKLDPVVRPFETEVLVASVSHVWPSAIPFEAELGDLFGIRFDGLDRGPGRVLLPDDWVGYPLRKGYAFPMEYQEIPHSRPVGQSVPDEYPT